MGTDIHTTLERRNSNGEWELIESDIDFGRCYAFFGWLNDVRNYSDVPVFSGTKSDIPADATKRSVDFHDYNHSACHVYVKDLMEFDYDAPVENRRVTRKMPNGVINGGCTCAEGEGEQTTYREIFGQWVIDRIGEIWRSGAQRVIISFDS